VIEINRRRNRVILSERAAMQEYRSQQKDRLLSELREGEIRRVRITIVRPFGVFVDLAGADGHAHLTELTWERGRTPEEVYRVGDEVDVYVMKVDPETKKIALSLRRAQPERWDEIVDNYRIGQIVPGRVTKLVTFGAFARVDGPVEGLIHVSELSDRRIQHPREVVREGDIVPLKILRIERDKHRIALSLRQARDDSERLGWEFDGNGSVISFPESLRPEIESKLGAAPERTVGEEDSADQGLSDQAPSPVAQPPEAREPRTPPPSPAPVQQREEPPVVSSPFEALRGFRSEADERRAAEEAASAEAAETTTDEAATDVPNGRIDASESSSADVSKAPEESAEDTSEDSGPERETIEASEESPERPDGESEPPPNDDETRPEASAPREEKAERS
ncbi:MAG: S1 RNA-binding domain-containing protein, partial [Dehalococcoidia bacterium]